MNFQEQFQEKYKCAKDPIYFLNNYGFVFDAVKKKIDRMQCFPYQEKCVRDFDEFQNNIVLKSRQTGLSVITAGYAAWRLMFRYDERILVIANDATGAERFLETVKQFISMTPKWLQPDQLLVNNTRRIAFSNGSWMQAKASSPDAGRGDSLTMLILDETAFIKDDQDIWMGAGMALSATKGKCIMISTPNGTGNLYHKTWVQAVNKDNDFNALTVHWTQNPQSSVGLKFVKNASGEEVPWSPWYEEQCKRLNWDSVKIAQELDLSFEGSKRLAVDPELVTKYKKKHQQLNPKPICYLRFDYLFKDELEKAASFILDETNFYIYKKPEEGKKYILAADVARGDGSDYSTIQILDVETLEQVAEYREKIGVDLFPYLINFVARYYNEAYVVVEANSFGLGVGYDMRDKFNYRKLFYSKNVQDIHVRPYDFKVAEGVDIPGFQTTPRTKPMIVKALIEHMREGSLIINSPRLLAELETFIAEGTKLNAEKGFNDDLIMAICIAIYIRDTEYQNVSMSNNMYKSMISAIGFNATSASGKVVKQTAQGEPDPNKKDTDFKGTGIFLSNNLLDDENNDLGWLLK